MESTGLYNTVSKKILNGRTMKSDQFGSNIPELFTDSLLELTSRVVLKRSLQNASLKQRTLSSDLRVKSLKYEPINHKWCQISSILFIRIIRVT